MEIRRLIEANLQNYFDCRLRALKSTPTAFLSSYDDAKEKGPSHFLKSLANKGNERAIFGAFDKQDLDGTVGIYREEHPKISHKAVIWGMHVDETYRGKQVGSKLLDTAIQFAKNEMKVASVNLSVESDNKAAIRLYQSRGFKCWGTEPKAMSHDGTYLNEDHMSLLF